MISEIDFAKKLGTYIRRLRNEKKYSIEKLAAISETDYSSLNKIENGKQNPTAYTLYKILFALDIDMTETFEKSNFEKNNTLQKLTLKLNIMPEDNLKSLYALLEEFEFNKKI